MIKRTLNTFLCFNILTAAEFYNPSAKLSSADPVQINPALQIFSPEIKKRIDVMRHGKKEVMIEALTFYNQNKDSIHSYLDQDYNWFMRGYLKTAGKLGNKQLVEEIISMSNQNRLDLYTKVTLAHYYYHWLLKFELAENVYKEVVTAKNSIDPLSKKAKIQALIGLGNIKAGGDQGRLEYYKRALALLGEAGDVSLRSQALIGLGNARADNVQIPYYKEALALLGETGDTTLRAQALIGLGNARADNVQIPHYQEALALLGEAGDVTLRAQALIGLGHARASRDQGITYYKAALDLLGETGDVTLRSQALIGLGHARAGRDQGITYYMAALDLLGKEGDITLRAQAHIGLGNARAGRDQGITCYKEALALLGETGDTTLRAQALIGLGNAKVGKIQGIVCYKDALALLGDEGDVSLRVQALIGLGNARADNVQIPHYREALSLLGETGEVTLRSQALIGLGNVLSATKENVEALKVFIQAYEIGFLPIKQKVWDILDKKSRYISKELENYRGADKKDIENWWNSHSQRP
ncbi:MAG: hypothetical protein CNLJKLNK_00228 [Holosporales bacterium]